MTLGSAVRFVRVLGFLVFTFCWQLAAMLLIYGVLLGLGLAFATVFAWLAEPVFLDAAQYDPLWSIIAWVIGGLVFLVFLSGRYRS